MTSPIRLTETPAFILADTNGHVILSDADIERIAVRVYEFVTQATTIIHVPPPEKP